MATGDELKTLRQKQQFHIHSEILFVSLQNILSDKSMDLQMVESEDFTFEDAEGNKKFDGLIFLWIILNDIKPSMVVDVQDLEKELEDCTLLKQQNNVQILTKQMEKTWKEIKRLKPGTYDERRFLIQLFRDLLTTTNEDFERSVRNLKDMWVHGDWICAVTYIITLFNKTYKNLVGEKSWGETSDKDAKIIAMTTSLNKQKNKWSEFATKMNSSGVPSAKKAK